jgi:hypothetical protein
MILEIIGHKGKWVKIDQLKQDRYETVLFEVEGQWWRF